MRAWGLGGVESARRVRLAAPSAAERSDTPARRPRVSDGQPERHAQDSTPCGVPSSCLSRGAVFDNVGATVTGVTRSPWVPTLSKGAPAGSAPGRGRAEATMIQPNERSRGPNIVYRPQHCLRGHPRGAHWGEGAPKLPRSSRTRGRPRAGGCAPTRWGWRSPARRWLRAHAMGIGGGGAQGHKAAGPQGHEAAGSQGPAGRGIQ
jgi:hypothetical protein